MYLVYILLQIIEKLDGERSMNAPYHLLRGKRSGQTLQDAKLYKIENFFGIAPKLSESIYEQTIQMMIEKEWIVNGENNLVHLTSIGKEQIQLGPKLSFNGWNYRGNEHLFFKRLSLFIQTISHLRRQKRSFLPIQKEVEIQQFVKDYLLRYQTVGLEQMSHLLFQEFQQAFSNWKIREEHKQIMIYRFSGYESIGWTWEQLAKEMKLDAVSVRLMFVEALHMILDDVLYSQHYSILRYFAHHIRVSNYLTDSASKTMDLFQQGHSLTAIAQKRKLKMSTIEDHLIEIASHSSTFPYEQFVTEEQIQLVLLRMKELQTLRLKVLKNAFPELSYFQLRLIVTKKEGSM